MSFEGTPLRAGRRHGQPGAGRDRRRSATATVGPRPAPSDGPRPATPARAGERWVAGRAAREPRRGRRPPRAGAGRDDLAVLHIVGARDWDRISAAVPVDLGGLDYRRRRVRGRHAHRARRRRRGGVPIGVGHLLRAGHDGAARGARAVAGGHRRPADPQRGAARRGRGGDPGARRVPRRQPAGGRGGPVAGRRRRAGGDERRRPGLGPAGRRRRHRPRWPRSTPVDDAAARPVGGPAHPRHQRGRGAA